MDETGDDFWGEEAVERGGGGLEPEEGGSCSSWMDVSDATAAMSKPEVEDSGAKDQLTWMRQFILLSWKRYHSSILSFALTL